MVSIVKLSRVEYKYSNMLSEYQVSDNMQFNNIQDEDEPLPAPPRRHFGRTLPFGRLENG